MDKSLPYLVTLGNIPKVLERIKSASTPERVSQDFVQTKLLIPGSSGRAMVPFLKRIGFVNSDGTPSAIYRRFRNAATSRTSVAEAIKHGYAPLYTRNEYMHDLSDQNLRGLIIEETGCDGDARPLDLTVSSIKFLKQFADFESEERHPNKEVAQSPQSTQTNQISVPHSLPSSRRLGMNLSYTINLNLPVTSDSAVFNAIFRSLKDHLLRDNEDDI